MAHTSLYRAYRPQSFGDIVGQQHVTRTLRNAVTEDAVAHAYLFTGPRGTGKTTTARILAKALDCEKGPTADPDTTCQQCVDIAEGNHPDVHELDAASRTQVDNVREEIIGRLAYAATRGPWKVYIIDEVHMLSNHSFNALLKSIEEPPPRTVFILCTTHPHKVPETIHSRCQRFDFHRIGVDDIADRLAYIAERENIAVAEGSLTLIAKHAAGGMRDAITTLEQLSSFTGKDIALDDVEDLLGEVDTALLVELADIVAARDVAASFRFVERITSSGVDVTEFVREFTGHVRDLFVTASVGDPTGIVDTTQDHLARLTSQAVAFGPDRLARMLDLLGELGAELRWSSDPRLSLEVSLTRMARPQGDLTLEALQERVEALETGATLQASRVETAPRAPEPEGVATAADAAAPPAPERGDTPHVADVKTADAPVSPASPGPPIAAGSGQLDRAHVKRAWPAVVAEVRRAKSSRSHIFANTEVDIDEEGTTLVVEFPSDQKFTMELASAPETRELLAESLAKVLEMSPPFRYQLGRGAVQPPVPRSEHDPDPPAREPVVAEADTPVTEPAVTEGDADIEEVLMNEFGAEMVAEHPHETGDGRDDS